MDKDIYQSAIEKNKIKRPIITNSLKAFVFGGLICMFGEAVRILIRKIFNCDEQTANTLMLFVVIFLASLFTGLGIYDKFGQIAGAGSFIPITGFANSLTSAATESKTEGLVQGTITNTFKLAGAIITIGVISSALVGSIIYLIRCSYA